MTARGLAVRDAAALIFAADMYGVQLDQLAACSGSSGPRARRRPAGAGSATRRPARLGPGPPWVWVTRAGLAACGLGYSPAPPALSRLAHIRAVAAARHRAGGDAPAPARGAYWRSERRLRARLGGRSACGSTCPTARCTGRTGRPALRPRRRRVLGDRGRADPEDRRAHHGDHAGAPRPAPATTAAPPPRPGYPGGRRGTRRVIYLCSPAAPATVAGRGTRSALRRPDRDPGPAAGRAMDRAARPTGPPGPPQADGGPR